ncbi:MAG TPA: hypothetical protein VK524_28745 [Polyangiaceae bacterium]|nr:hypothetical protein [Polyangiaceae bacterium]
MKSWIFALVMAPVLYGCGAGDAHDSTDAGDDEWMSDDEAREQEQARIGTTKAAIVTGCPDDAPLCSCALKNEQICKDPDRDGLLSLYDNCDYVANPNQANCDGDYSGDACDSNNVTVTRTTQRADTPAVPTGATYCVYDEDVHSILFGEIEWQTGTRTIETSRYCGPSGNRTETRVVSTDIDTHRCWGINYFGCDFRGNGSLPGSICR